MLLYNHVCTRVPYLCDHSFTLLLNYFVLLSLEIWNFFHHFLRKYWVEWWKKYHVTELFQKVSIWISKMKFANFARDLRQQRSLKLNYGFFKELHKYNEDYEPGRAMSIVTYSTVKLNYLQFRQVSQNKKKIKINCQLLNHF